jgi:hypothetical protein
MAKVMKVIGNDIVDVIATGCRDSSVARERCAVPSDFRRAAHLDPFLEDNVHGKEVKSDL